jgi:hypothetical protein
MVYDFSPESTKATLSAPVTTSTLSVVLDMVSTMLSDLLSLACSSTLLFTQVANPFIVTVTS